MPTNNSPSGLFISYLRLVLRNFYKNRAYTLLNLFGLSIGFTIFILTIIYVDFETGFESFHQKSNRIFRVTHRFESTDGAQVHWARIPFDYINELPNDIHSIESLIRFQNHERKYIRVGDNKFKPEHAYVTDKEVFNVFDFNLIAGDPATALAEPRSIVITRAVAQKYFGEEDPINKEVFVIGDLDKTETLHRVTGVMEDLPANTHLPVDVLISFKDKSERSGWAYTYVLFKDGATIDDVDAQLPAFVKKYDTSDEAKTMKLVLQPLKDIHLHSNVAREIVPNGNIFYVNMVRFAGIFILIIAVVNFMNLNSAMALGRAKEVGVRKIMGAKRHQLAAYLFIECITSNTIALLAGSLIAYAVFPLLQTFITINALINFWWIAILMIAVAIVCGIVTGLYPVLLLISLNPIATVRSNKAFSFVRKQNPFNLKRIMVTLQFCISIILGGSALVAYSQFHFLNNKNLGMHHEQIIAIPGVPDQVKDQFLSFKSALSANPGVINVAACMEVPSREIRDIGPVLVQGVNEDPLKAPRMDIQIIDNDFISLLGIELLAGENISVMTGDQQVPEFSENYTFQNYLADQKRSYLINETAMRRLGWQTPGEAVGQNISWSIGDLKLSYGAVRGVVRDFHQESLKNKIDPIIMVQEPIWFRTFLIKVETKDIQATLGNIKVTWDKTFPLYPMDYYFLDDLYDNLYKGERIQLQLLYIFSGLAIFIAFIGLIGLIAYALRTRVKEIAIRKVMGASIADLIRMISREYLMILLVSSVLAIPVSVYGLNEWLSSFAYRVDISPLSYVVAVSAIGGLLLLTLGLQTLGTSSINPAATLRNE